MDYIQELATDLLSRFGTDMSRVAVVFPNKRASLFLNETLSRLSPDKPIWSPAYITISELFRHHSDLEVADPILLICRLYEVFIRHTGFSAESLDRFYSWGQILLADFDDLDKNMADADKVFRLVSDLHELDDISYITDDQKEALSHFFSNFKDDHLSMMREKFLHLWKNLGAIYHDYRQTLRDDKLAYEGMLYRDVAEDEAISFEYDYYCFVGFNMLQRVEQTLFHRLQKDDKALFYWDYDDYYLKENHEAGHFISEYKSMFGDSLNTSHDHLVSNGKSITYVSAPTETVQSRYVRSWLLENDRWKAGARTAIVLSDERLLQGVIRSLPEVVDKVNITTGYPLSQSPVVSFIHHLFELYIAGRYIGTSKYRIRFVRNVLQHPLATLMSSATTEVLCELRDNKTHYPTREQLSVDEGLAMLFTDIDQLTDASDDSPSTNLKIILWLQGIMRYIAHRKQLDALDQESVFRTYTLLQRMADIVRSGILDIDVTTLRRLLQQIIASTTIPFHGEPIEGVQIMGVLETRALDFDNILLLSCNEGNLPKGVNDTSFIPHIVRKAYGLTTVEHKVGIYSYYFHRLLQRAHDVTITYNSSTEGMNTGEMSRFMLQLMVESGLPIRRVSLQTDMEAIHISPERIDKDEKIMSRLEDIILHGAVSPSSLSRYMRCQLNYFYNYVLELHEPDAEEDEMDNKMFGTIFHNVAEQIYNNHTDDKGHVDADMLSRLRRDKIRLSRYLDNAFAHELYHVADPASFHPEYSGLQLINRKVILRLIDDLLQYDSTHGPIRILGTEKKVYGDIPVQLHDGRAQNVRMGGIVDRLDIVDGTMRVIDYKTGNREQGKVKAISDIFQPENIGNHTDYYLQAMLYSTLIRHSKVHNPDNRPVSPALLFVQKVRREDYTPILSIGDSPITDIADVEQDFRDSISQLLAEILDPAMPFLPTEDKSRCDLCPYKKLCGV